MEKEKPVFTAEVLDAKMLDLRKYIELVRFGKMTVGVFTMDAILDEVERLRVLEAKVKEIAVTPERDEWHGVEMLDQIREIVGWV